MIRSRSNLTKLYKKNINFIWYKSIWNLYKWYMDVSWSLHWHLYWYNKKWVKHIYLLREFDAVSRRWRRRLKKTMPDIYYKNYMIKTNYRLEELIYWRRIKYSILFNYLILCKTFFQYMYKLIQYFKNDILMFTSFYLNIQTSECIIDNQFLYSFYVSKNYWNFFFKLKYFNFNEFLVFTLKHSKMYSHFSYFTLFNPKIKQNYTNLYENKLLIKNVFININTISNLNTTESIKDDENLSSIIDFYNTYDFLITKLQVIEIYKILILLTLKNIK